MKNFKRKEWEVKRTEIINEINSTPNSKFRKDDFLGKIKRNVPKNSTNKDEVIDSLSDVGKGTGAVIFGNGKKTSWGSTIDQQKEDLIEILNLIELKRFRVFKNVISFIRKKIDWKWLIGIVLVIIGLLIEMYWV